MRVSRQPLGFIFVFVTSFLFLTIIELSFSWTSISSSIRHDVTRSLLHWKQNYDTRPWALAATIINIGDNASDDTKNTGANRTTAAAADTSWSNDEFQEWIHQQLVEEAGPILHETYGDSMFVQLAQCITRWRLRFQLGDDATLWKRLFKRDRVVKEVIESIPIIQAIEAWIEEESSQREKVTIIDLCSGKGYLSMLLSEYLPPEKVEKLVLIDKAWPMCFAVPKAHHMNWDHIYGNYTTGDNAKASYFTTWPIPLHTSKQDLKQKSTFRQLKKRLAKREGPTFILGVHLCGTLSIQAVSLFHAIESVQGLILKPCCLPGMAYERSQENFILGSYAFPTKEVCAVGKWTKKEWEGPPRWHLEKKFDSWCFHLHKGMQGIGNVHARLVEIPVQTSGGFQNKFIFAEKEPTSSSMWDVIQVSDEKLALGDKL